MKKNHFNGGWKAAVIATFCLIVMVACKDKKDVEPVRSLDGAPTAALVTARASNVNGSVLDVQIDMFVVDKNGNFIRGLGKGDFKPINLSDVSFAEKEFKSGRLSTQNAGYSALMLLDQSGSILSTDPSDLRIEGCKAFLNGLGRDDHAALASFTGNYTSNTNYARLHRGFSQKATDFMPSLDTLSYSVGGGTPLFLSTYGLMSYVVKNAPTSNRAMIVFTDGEDTNGGVTLRQVTDLAKQSNVRLYTVGLSESVEEGVLAEMASESNGAFFWAKDAKQLITAFGTLGDLLDGTAQLYQATWTATRSRAWRSGDVITSRVDIKLPTGETLSVPFRIRVP